MSGHHPQHEPDPAERLDFGHLAVGPCPPLADMCLAVAAEFRTVDADGAFHRLDELARPLFRTTAVAEDEPGRSAARLAETIRGIPGLRIDSASVRALWLDAALEHGVAHPLVLAVVAAEVGRRAGLTTSLFSTPTGWYAGLVEGERLWLVDPPLEGGAPSTDRLRRHCAHELAFAMLAGVAERSARSGDDERVARAARLRARLPLSERAADPPPPRPDLLELLRNAPWRTR